MKSRTGLFFVLFTTLAVLPIKAQGRPASGQGGGQHHPAQGQGQRGSAMGKGTAQHDQKRIHATTQQRNQIRACDQAAEQIRQRARTLARTAQGTGVQAGTIREQAMQLRQQFRTMQEAHSRLLESLDAEQRILLQEHIRNMEQIRERAGMQLSTIETESARSDPDRKRIAEQARELEQHMKEWQKQYREMNRRMFAP